MSLSLSLSLHATLMAMINRANEECHAVLITTAEHPSDRVKNRIKKETWLNCSVSVEIANFKSNRPVEEREDTLGENA